MFYFVVKHYKEKLYDWEVDFYLLPIFLFLLPIIIILQQEQRYFVENLDKDNIVLKSRQLGLSSITIALSIRACIVQDNTTCVLISHNQTSTNSIFAKLKQQFF